MPIRFSQLDIGDMFNTKSARWVKIDDRHAMCVMSAVLDLGYEKTFNLNDDTIVVLYSRLLDEH